MKKIIYFYIILTSLANNARADHIKGGEISYILKSVAGSDYTYTVTVKMYMECNSYREFYNPTFVSVFNRKTGIRVRDLSVPITKIEVTSLTDNDDCITNPPQVCNRIGYYIFDVTLPASPDGYLLTTEVFFRVNNMSNLMPGYQNIGATYTAEIPGTFNITTGPKNNSAKFADSDLVIVCAGHEFNYSFAAEDNDGDALAYSMTYAYRSDNFMFGIDLTPAAPPPYGSVPYGPEYSGGKPLGNNVKIDEHTGMISGIAPSPGTYVIAVSVEERRNGQYIATQRKDLQINVASCSFTSASLADTYLLCGNTNTVNLENLSVSELIQTYKWSITNNVGETIFSSASPTVNYTFADTGVYNVNLKINENAKCADSTDSQIKVYPGFKPDFNYKGVCLDKATQFTDATSSVYGTINSWQWNFTGDILSDAVSNTQNPVYNYTSLGNKSVSLIVTDSKGCIDTVYKNIEIFEKPPIQLAFTDTLICKPDTLQLIANAVGIYNWTPANEILNANTSNPTIIPTHTTKYYVDLDRDGCTNRDSVTVNVVDHVTMQAMKDTTICKGDAIQLHNISDALHYTWQPANQLNDATIQQPFATTSSNTKYTVTANIGSCTASDEINVVTVPYPVSLAGNDTIICFGTNVSLNGVTDGNRFEWSPSVGLFNYTSLHTIANPTTTTTYILTTYDIKGCPKPGIDSVTVTVLPKINVYAGHDTAIVINQPLQLNGSGGSTYTWSPPNNLSSPFIASPVAQFYYPSDGNRYKLIVNNEAGCADSAFITIKVYKTLPSVFVPTGFTPNRDGKNDILKPILAGIQRIQMFNVYNRLGQLIFSTSTEGRGWDGTIDGIPQNTGTYVWMVKAVDYNGVPYFNKGTVTLIR
ncbi:T9SS type B sorting domain-containing protein [Panacibacter ginsenosidivorans]|uniref:T9SS type B sorting domain-containing protein n=1 Tax=Panacibacter ginsenosidivorans TaxID=1813871 RepID=A0A5B8V8T5_9BACT|nr:PKD domain-containing protein [Panacibacter ginsenosidivorans]QEC67752.1 T9SS type B sorting domain-containing protein [Panacibacter ginsenosidivorans]